MNPGFLAAIVAMLGWGIADFLGAQLSKAIGEIRAVLGVQIGALIVLLVLFPWFWQRNQLAWSDLILIGVESVVFVAANLLFYKALRVGVVAIVSPVFSSYAVIPVIVGLSLLKERIGSIGVVGVCLVAVGILMTASDWRASNMPGWTSLAKGLPEALGAMVLVGSFFTLLASLTHRLGWYSPVLLIRLGSLAAVAVLFLVSGTAKPSAWLIPRRALIAGSLDSIAILAFAVGVQMAPLAVVAPVSAAFPLVTILLAATVQHERPALIQWLGIGAIIAGTILLSWVGA